MAFGSIELTTISRAQDYSIMKQNEDNKAMTDQTHLGHKAQRTQETRANSVTDSQNADWHNQRQDAREKGRNEYAGDGGKKRAKKEPVEKVVVKGRPNFDIKI